MYVDTLGHFGFTKLELLGVDPGVKTGLECIFLVNQTVHIRLDSVRVAQIQLSVLTGIFCYSK